MNKDKEEFLSLLEAEIEIFDKRLRDKLGDETVDKINKLMDEYLSVAIKKQFDNLATSESELQD